MIGGRSETADAWALVANLKTSDRKGIRKGEKLWLASPNYGSGLDRNRMHSNRTGLEKWVRADRLTNWRIAWVPISLREKILTRPSRDDPNMIADVASLGRRSLVGNPLAEAEIMAGWKAIEAHRARFAEKGEIANAA